MSNHCVLSHLSTWGLGDQNRVELILSRLGFTRPLLPPWFFLTLSTLVLPTHESTHEGHLDPLLRLYEGCASRTIGRPEEANVIKFHSRKPKITYLVYPDFDADPHPALYTSMQIDLRDLHVHYRDHDPNENPPVLHQKDLLVTPEYSHYEKFAKLSRQEEDWGLLDDWKRISLSAPETFAVGVAVCAHFHESVDGFDEWLGLNLHLSPRNGMTIWCDG